MIDDTRFETSWRLIVRTVLLVAALGLGLWLAVSLRAVLLQLLLALILATGLTPLVDWLAGRGLPRGAAVLLIYLVLVLGLVLLGVLLVPPILDEIERLAANAPTYGDRLADWLRALQRQYPLLPPLDEQLAQQVRGLGGQLAVLAAQAVTVARLAVGVFSGALHGVLVLILTLYLVVFGQTIREYLLAFVPAARRPLLRRLTDRMGRRMGGWLLGQVVLSLVIGGLTAVGLSVLGVRYALLLACIAAVGELIPTLGPIVAAIPAIVVAAFDSPLLALAVAGLYLAVQQLENHLLVPKVMERAVELHPFATLVALLVGAELLGVLGAILAVPVAAALAVVLDEVRAARARAEALPEASGPVAVAPGASVGASAAQGGPAGAV
ncbi:MAG TPA: AI-2E family transporter [Chloroflexota bacterium]|nr:AI-2E family transporter [Chloroflexota bacterium]